MSQTNNPFKSTRLQLPGQQYEIIKLIGQGAESEVFEGKNQTTLQKVAIKKYKKGIRVSEVGVLQNLQGQFLIHLMMVKDIIYDNQQISAIVMDLADGNLNSYMETSQEFKRMNTKEKNKLFLQIVQGVVELHNKNLFHRDLKPQNIVYLDRNQVILKICDFGFVKEIVNFGSQTIGVGTCIYRPLEQISNIYDSSVDIWALGVIWCEMLGVKYRSLHKFTEQSKLNDFVKSEVQNILDNSELDILLKMLIIDPSQRLKAFQIESSLKQLLGTNPLIYSTRLQTPLTFNIQPQTFRISTPLLLANQIEPNNNNPFLSLANYANQDKLIPKQILDSCCQIIQQSGSDENIKKLYSCLQMNIGQIIKNYEKHQNILEFVSNFQQPKQLEEYQKIFIELNQIRLEGKECLDFLKNELIVQASLSEPKTYGRKKRRTKTLDALNIIKNQLETDFYNLNKIISQFDENLKNQQLNLLLSNFTSRITNQREEKKQLEYLRDNVCYVYNNIKNDTKLAQLSFMREKYLNQQISDLDSLINELKSYFTKILENEIFKTQIKLYHLERMIQRLKPWDQECQNLNDEIVNFKKGVEDYKQISNDINTLANQNKEIQKDQKNIENKTCTLLQKITKLNQETFAQASKGYQLIFLEDHFLEFKKIQILK